METVKSTYLYISFSLKDSYVCGETLFPAFHDGIYTAPLRKSLKGLSRRTTRDSLAVRYKILEGKDGTPTELRLIIRCPGGWTAERFQQEALRGFAENPSVETIIFCHSAASVDMDLGFLTREWKGSGGRLATL